MTQQQDAPDINKLDELAAAIGDIEVLGGLSRSFTIDPETGGSEPDRYIEKVSDYLSDHAIRCALERAFAHSHYVAGVDGAITSASRDELTLTYADGTEATFVRASPGQSDSV